MDEGRLIVSLVWGPAVVIVWGRVLADGWREWRIYRDSRAKAEFLTDLSLFFVAFCSMASILLFITTPAGTGTPATRLVTTMALGAFLAAGIISVTMGKRRE